MYQMNGVKHCAVLMEILLDMGPMSLWRKLLATPMAKSISQLDSKQLYYMPGN